MQFYLDDEATQFKNTIQNTYKGLLPTITRLYDYDINTIKTASIYYVISGSHLPSNNGYTYLFTLSDKNVTGDILQFGFEISNVKLHRRHYSANRNEWVNWTSITFT
jgi:hypothetical protein